MKRHRFARFLPLACSLLLSAAFSPPGAAATTVKGAVSDLSKQPIAKASVYLIPAADVEQLAKAPVQLKKNSANDEPLEDSLSANRDKYARGLTDAKGNFSIPKVADGKYFVYVEPSDADHLPGGDLANKAMSASELGRKPLRIAVSGKTPEGATFVGSSQCLGCHAENASIKKTMHKLGISVIGKPSGLQDTSRFPGMNDGLKKLMAGTTLYFFGFDKSRRFDKYLVSEKVPADASTVSFSASFFTDSDGKLKFRTRNARDAADPERLYTVEMTYGGGVYKQRYLFRAGDHLFPFVQYNPGGKEEYADRTRKVWRDYHADWLFNEATGKLGDPPKGKSFDRECASCHYNGYGLKPNASGELVATAVNDPNGEADIDGDGTPNELNIGCETCHGPGSAHVGAAMARKASTIVNPRKLAAERSTTICVQCHSRPQGFLKNDQPVSKDNRMLTAGMSRNDYLLNHTTREDAAPGDFWADGLHSKSHHQQGTDLVRSKHYLNGNQLLSCASCHDPHGRAENSHQLKLQARDGQNSLCASCHKAVSIQQHTQQKVGFEHAVQINCVDCHMPKTSQTGAGFGKGAAAGDGRAYWVNDVSSHLFTVPRKENKAVKGVEPGKAMPIPYTRGCSTCHNTEKL